jgi:hypothetical protein
MQIARSSDRASRIKRIKNRGCPEVIQALDRGELGIKTLERLTRFLHQVMACAKARHDWSRW